MTRDGAAPPTSPGAPIVMKYLDVAPQGEGYLAALRETEIPRPRADEVLVRVAASGVNRADLSQIAGPLPAASG